MLGDKRSRDRKIKSELKDSIDLSSDVERSRDSMIIEPTTSMALALEYPPIISTLCDYETDNGFESCELPPIQPIHKSESSTSLEVCGSSNGHNAVANVIANANGGGGEITSCVVCEKKFKSKSYLKKHLRTVHTGIKQT